MQFVKKTTRLPNGVINTECIDVTTNLVVNDSFCSKKCCCEIEIKEHYLCLNGIKTPVWVSIDQNLNVIKVVDSLNLNVVPSTEYVNGFIDPCSVCN